MSYLLALQVVVVEVGDEDFVPGSGHFYLENHRGILSYSGEEIDINGEGMVIRVFGSGLELVSMTGDALRIRGSIQRVEWEK